MSSFNLKIVTPEKLIFDGTAEKIVVRTSEGDIGILKNHIPYVSALGIGQFTLFDGKGMRRAAVADGFVNVSKEETVILAGTFEWEEEIDVARAEKAKAEAQRRIEDKSRESELKISELKLKRALNRLRIGK